MALIGSSKECVALDVEGNRTIKEGPRDAAHEVSFGEAMVRESNVVSTSIYKFH